MATYIDAEQKQQAITEWLTNLSTRHLIALAAQQKIAEYANRPHKYLIEVLSKNPEVQLQALDMLSRGEQ